MIFVEMYYKQSNLKFKLEAVISFPIMTIITTLSTLLSFIQKYFSASKIRYIYVYPGKHYVRVGKRETITCYVPVGIRG